MLIAAHEKKQHPEYQEYVENFEATLTGLEAGLRGGGNPGLTECCRLCPMSVQPNEMNSS